jgi:hypothetical protein
MSRLNDLADYGDIVSVFTGVLSVTALERNVRIKILGDEDLKQIGIVNKASVR